MFGLSLSDRLDSTYYTIFILTVLIFAGIIFRLATLNYVPFKQKAEKEITHQYKKFISQLIINEVKKVAPNIKSIHQLVLPPPVSIAHSRPTVTVVPENELKAQRRQLANRIRKERTILQQNQLACKTGTGANIASELPAGLKAFSDDDDMFDPNIAAIADAHEAAQKIKTRVRPVNTVVSAQTAQINNFDPGDITTGDVKLFNYVVKRKGSAYLDVPEQLIKEPPVQEGYRDPTEVEEVVRRYAPMIDYCFRKHTRYSPDTKGFIQVAFKVSYEGYVIPESVRIVNSSIKNKPLEQCIKNYIKYWRDFKRLDPSMGIAQIVQKFVFN